MAQSYKTENNMNEILSRLVDIGPEAPLTRSVIPGPLQAHVLLLRLPKYMLCIVERRQCYEMLLLLDAVDRKSTRLNSSHSGESRMPSSA